MLVLKRLHGESVTVFSLDLDGKPLARLDITVERGGSVRLGFTADQGDFRIIRTELLAPTTEGNGDAP